MRYSIDGEKLIIGVLGGMGTYATIHLFRQYAEIFPAEKEWDRPRILIDNNCTMPSRVRAVLYHENEDLLVHEMTGSIRNLMAAGANRIVLGCNTSHLFLDRVYESLPEAEPLVVNIIDTCVERLKRDQVRSVYLLATEGTILSNVYQDKLVRSGISCSAPSEKEFPGIRECIEAVKQNHYTDEVKDIFRDFTGRGETCILGCTELPVLYEKCGRDPASDRRIYDPLELSLLRIKEESSGGGS